MAVAEQLGTTTTTVNIDIIKTLFNDDDNNMSGYSSVESAENLPVAMPKAEMVEVEAPGNLSAGYTFQASYNGVVFPVTVVRDVKWTEVLL